MKIDFWYSKIIPTTNIQSLLENIDETISFKDIDVENIINHKSLI